MFTTLIIFLFIIFYKCKYVESGKAFFEDYLGLNQSRAIKGVFSIVVVLHHLSQRVQVSTDTVKIFSNVGYLAVGMFFFYSGYGVMYSIQNKKGYLDNFFSEETT